jgi:hypothetical protein
MPTLENWPGRSRQSFWRFPADQFVRPSAPSRRRKSGALGEEASLMGTADDDRAARYAIQWFGNINKSC